jgi:putative toxin-antitoxin system antitoxin component (TIGR02293 family)
MAEMDVRPARAAAGGGVYRQLYRAQAMERIRLIADGVQAEDAKRWLEIAALGRNATLAALDLPVATFNRKVRAGGRLSQAESERVIGFARLVGQVEAMMEDAGVAAGFDARAWLAGWLVRPVPALGGARPIDLMGTMEGQGLVSQTLAQIGSGAYA